MHCSHATRFAATTLIVAAVVLTTAMSAIAAPVRAPLIGVVPQVHENALDVPSLHPSGNDRTDENGGSGTQGKAQSDPDGTYNYGVDQIGNIPAGGIYLFDQDGNNGCGNDQDFEDDNNGNCGPRARLACAVPSTVVRGKSSSHRTYRLAPCTEPGTVIIPVTPVESSVDTDLDTSPTQTVAENFLQGLSF